MHELKITDLTVKIENKIILNNFDLVIRSGEIHAILGPNGTGKSTLSKVIMGDSNYLVMGGKIEFDGVLINDLTTDERARMGLFLGMQMPISIDGVTNADFLRTALHTKDGNNFKLMEFIKKMNNTCDKLKISRDMIHRSVNKGFSGGERKKNEILQMYLLNPSIVLLDEIDSGLDMDSLKIVGEALTDYYEENQPGILLITHYQRLLDYIKPDFVHVMIDGKIIKSGSVELVKIIEEKGYEFIKESSKNVVKEK